MLSPPPFLLRTLSELQLSDSIQYTYSLFWSFSLCVCEGEGGRVDEFSSILISRAEWFLTPLVVPSFCRVTYCIEGPWKESSLGTRWIVSFLSCPIGPTWASYHYYNYFQPHTWCEILPLSTLHNLSGNPLFHITIRVIFWLSFCTRTSVSCSLSQLFFHSLFTKIPCFLFICLLVPLYISHPRLVPLSSSSFHTVPILIWNIYVKPSLPRPWSGFNDNVGLYFTYTLPRNQAIPLHLIYPWQVRF